MDPITPSLDLTDADLVSFINTGDEIAFRTLVEHYRPILIKNARAYRGISEDEAEDVVQAIFMRIWDNHRTWHTTSVSRYLYAAVRNEIITLHYAHTKVEKLETELSYSQGDRSSHVSTDYLALQKEFNQMVNDVVELRSGTDQQIYRMATDERMSYA